MHDFLTIFIFSGIAGLATIIGIILVLYRIKWATRNSIYLISFAAGTLLAGSFFSIIPKAMGLYSESLFVVLLGFLIFYVIENAIMVHSCDEKDCPEHIFGTVSTIGLAFHSLLDGIAIGVGFELNFSLGVIASLAVISHELPEGISSMSVMIHSGFEKKKGIIYSLIIALATPIGAIASFFLLQGISIEIFAMLLSLAAGSFLYVAASDMIPETHKKFRKANFMILLLGITFIYLIGILV